MDGWRTDIGYPEDRDRAEKRLEDGEPAAESGQTVNATNE